PEQVFPDAAPSPAHKAVIDRCRRTILRRAIAPATAALQYMHDAADDSAIVRPLDAPDICRQVRLDPLPLLIAQPKQVAAHDPNPLPKTNQDRIVRAEKLMSSDPSHRERTILVPGVTAREISAENCERGPATTARYYFVDDWLYQVTVVGPTGMGSSIETQHFMESFRIIGK